MSKVYRPDTDGVYRWFNVEKGYYSPVSATIHQDTLKQPLRHMVTGEICESKSRLEELNRQTGCVCVGNDFVGHTNKVPDKISESLVMSRIEQAEAIVNNRDKLREFRGRRFEDYQRVMNSGRIAGYVEKN